MKSVTLKEAWSGEADCRHCALRKSALFSGLTAADFEHIHEPIDQFTLPPGSLLYRTRDPSEFMFTVRTGILKLVQYLPDGGQRIVRLDRSTDVLGLECLVEPTYHHHAIVLHSAQICRYPAVVVQQLSADNPILHQELMKRWQRALTEADLWLTELSTGTAKQRVARLIIRLSNHENSRCELFSREDMGAMLGITTETTSRIMAEFKRNSLLVETSPNIFLIDLPNLRRMADS
jgi:CRP-like cAMP-binding protein